MDRTELSLVKGWWLLQGTSCCIYSYLLPSLDTGKFLVWPTLNFSHCLWPCHRFSSKLSLDCLLLQCPEVSMWPVHGYVLSSPWLPLHGCCLHNPSAAFSAMTKSWCMVGATSRDGTLVIDSTLLLLGVVLRAIQSVQVFCSGKQSIKVKPLSSWIIMALHIRERNHIQGTTRWLWRGGNGKGIRKNPWEIHG